jgi:hypothetical protein
MHALNKNYAAQMEIEEEGGAQALAQAAKER